MKHMHTLKWQILRLMVLGWFLPLTAAILLFLLVVAGRIDTQSMRIITTSMENAAKISVLRISDCVDASKDASYLPNIKDSYNEYNKSGDRGKLYNNVTVFLAEQYKYNPCFDMTVLIFTDDPENLYYTGNTTGRGSVSRIRYFKDSARSIVLEKSKDLDTRTEFFSSDGHVYMIRNLMKRNFEPYAVLVMELNPEKVFESLKSVWAYKGMSIFYGDELLYSEGDTGISTLPVGDGKNDVFMTVSDTEDVVCCSQKTDNGVFGYVISYDASLVNIERRSVSITFWVLIVFLIPLIILVLYFFHKKINIPIKSLTDASKQIASGKYGVTAPLPKADSGEIADLTRNFNHMSVKLSEQFNKIFTEEIALRDANIHALQSQINPHFLNNTLEIINWEARINGQEKVSSMIEALSTMMSATMDRNRQSLISLEEEMEYVQAYLYIIKCRYQDKFTYTEDIDPSLMYVKVPRLIIQPVVENAVEYSSCEDGSRHVTLKIEGSCDQDHVDMKISIINPGVPSKEDMDKITGLLTDDMDIKPLEERSTRIGIRNVHRRLRIIYGSESGLSIRSDGNGNTISTIFVKK
ncbi:HAMP domain-containing protein [Butyrivibrio fibrisolvens]|uniref:HAMP domain-containing protein n=1 Tax=Butyrivibrio fibrisolvens TaxID=831 RepID=A0A1H9SU52_BUTFI|nr:histidine kinase [Butyrivibrio fibrisolvens]SER88384.1 HAMP domain-containing protein [Butyrivibrio fibrisolvens]